MGADYGLITCKEGVVMGKRLVLFGILLSALLVAFQAPMAHSAQAPRNSGLTHGWLDFSWAEDGWSNVISTSFSGPVRLYVADLYCRGDVFDVYDNGVLVGTTSFVPLDPECDDLPWRQNPREAFLDPTYSSGLFELESGDGHDIQLYAVQNPFGSGAGALHAHGLTDGS
jgi:hypothetical protein